jgi:hypothetical protein
MVSPKGALGGAAVGFKTQTVLFMFVCNKGTDKGTLGGVWNNPRTGRKNGPGTNLTQERHLRRPDT